MSESLVPNNKLKRLFEKIRMFIRSKLKHEEDDIYSMQTDKYFMDVFPKMKNYSVIELSNLANIENKLQRAIVLNDQTGKVVEGITLEEADKLMEWVVQSGRKNMFKDRRMDESTFGWCGLGQAINGETLINMGLNPYICNVRETFSPKDSHAFCAVEIPISQSERREKELYLLDMTYRQFFVKDATYGDWITDDKFGGKVGSFPGYWLLHMKRGKELAKEILQNGYFKVTPEKLKLYGDSFVLANNERDDSSLPPRDTDLNTNISAEEYVSKIRDRSNEEMIDKAIGEMEGEYGYNLNTPLMERASFMNIKPTIPRISIDELKRKKMYDDYEPTR